MSKKHHNTSSGDRKRARAAGHRQPRRKALEGNRIRVRTKRLDQVDEEKLTLAFWMLARAIVQDETDERELTEAEVRKVMDANERLTMDGSHGPADEASS